MTVPRNFYDEVGGAPVFHKIVARFYEEVRDDSVLRPLYPEEDLGPAEDRLRMFLEQYWGGPRTYSDQRGHPRLRMRHFPFRIGADRARRLAALHADRGRRGRARARAPRPALAVPGVRRGQHGQLTGLTSRHPWQDAPVQWWRDAVFYQVYVPSFTDSDGDGIGDLQGIRGRLGYLELLGVDALWLSPIYASPMVDNGYDITDHRAVDPVWGDLDAVDELIADAHAHGIRVTVDLVPNHTSDQHPWFRAALASPTGSPERDRYHFRPGQGVGGAEPPNSWRSVFGGSAWTREPARDEGPGEWFLHLFSPAQPDLNWTNLEVWADLDKTLRFWLDRGVDGFRIDAAHGMCKQLDATPTSSDDDPRFDQDDVHDVHRMIRATLDHYPERVAIGAVGVRNAARFARYVRQDELHLAVDTQLAASRFDAEEVRAAIEDCLNAVGSVGAAASWLLSDHDVSRPASRYGAGPVGTARARAMALVQLALPGAAYLYNGDELGLPDADLPDEARRDAVWHHGEDSRDGCRVPQPWEADLPAYGFTTGEPWLPIPDDYAAAGAADAARGHRLHALALPPRAGAAPVNTRASRRPVARPRAGVVRRPRPAASPSGATGTTLVCALNTSPAPVPLPPGDPLLVSGPLGRRHAAPRHRGLARLTRPGSPGQVSSGRAVTRRRTTAP